MEADAAAPRLISSQGFRMGKHSESHGLKNRGETVPHGCRAANGRKAETKEVEMADNERSLSGLSEAEAREFHSVFMTSFLVFVVIAAIAHVLAWMWRPWLPGPKGYALLDTGVAHVSALVSMLT